MPVSRKTSRQALDDGLGVVVDVEETSRCGRAVATEQHQIGEGAADIGADAVLDHQRLLRGRRMWSAPRDGVFRPSPFGQGYRI